MKRFLLPFLAAVLCLQQGTLHGTYREQGTAAAIQCYTCDAITPSSECNLVVNCTEKVKFCKTTVYAAEIGFPFQGDESVTRSCAITCTESNLDEIGLENPVLCCSKNLCNCRAIANSTCTSSSPTTGSGGSYPLLASALVYWAICKTQQ